jgi:hypothetical protein
MLMTVFTPERGIVPKSVAYKSCGPSGYILAFEFASEMFFANPVLYVKVPKSMPEVEKRTGGPTAWTVRIAAGVTGAQAG